MERIFLIIVVGISVMLSYMLLLDFTELSRRAGRSYGRLKLCQSRHLMQGDIEMKISWGRGFICNRS